MVQVQFVADAASFQGNVDWDAADEELVGGWEKVTEGTKYANPYWPAAKQAMARRATRSGFTPGAYIFLDALASGEAQADFFAAHAGDLTGFGIAVDLERAPDGPPTVAQAIAATTRLRGHYPAHRIAGYAPEWFAGSAHLGFFDWLWASHYVDGEGHPARIFPSVPAGYWHEYGGLAPALLQFTSQATIPGINGLVDCSAFLGTAAEYRALVLPHTEGTDMTPAAVTALDGVHMFAVGTDHAVWHYPPGKGRPEPIGSPHGKPVRSGVAAVLAPDTSIHVLVEGDDTHLWVRTFRAGAWTGWWDRGGRLAT